MAKIIPISGEIGWEVMPYEVRAQINAAKGEDIEFQISSPGGYVYDGLEIFNMIRNYEGNTTARIIGMAASMASYIPLAADKVIAESNAIYMIHNARAYTGGDQNAHEKVASILRGMSNMFGQEYIAQTGKSKKEIASLMDAETYYFGNEILEAGFVDEIVQVDPTEKEAARDEAIYNVMVKVEACDDKLKTNPEKIENINKIAALLPFPKPANVPVNSNSKKENMTLEEFLAFLEKHPEAKAAFEEAVTAAKASVTPDFENLELEKYLALSPTAKTEHETALVAARTEVESGKLTAETVKSVGAIIASDAYGQSIKNSGIKVLTGEKDYSAFEDLVALADEQNEKIKSLQVQGSQPPGTPPVPGNPADKSTMNSPVVMASVEDMKKALNDTTKVQ